MEVMNEQHPRPGKTNYDWINGMRVGILFGAIVGLLVWFLVGGFPILWLIVGAACGGFLGAKMAPRW